MLTQTRLKELLSYDPATGLFIRLCDIGGQKKGAIVGSVTGPQGHLSVKLDGTPYYLHRLAFLYMTGIIPPVIDHIDLNPTNNRWSNLRPSTLKENKSNNQVYCTNTTGYPGVSRRKGSSDFFVCLEHNKKRINLGRFSTLEEAIKARKDAEDFYGVQQNHKARGVLEALQLVSDLL